MGIEDKWEQLLAALGEAEKLHLFIDDEGRSAAIIQLAAILNFLHGTTAATTPLVILLGALQDLQDGTAKPAKILEPKRAKHRRRDDLSLRTFKLVTSVVMDQLLEHAEMSREEAAKAIAKTLSEFRLSEFRGRRISWITLAKWRDLVKAAPETSETGREFKRILSIDANALAQDAPLERKRNFLLARRLPLLLIQLGAQGPKADKTRQSLTADIERRIPKKPHC